MPNWDFSLEPIVIPNPAPLSQPLLGETSPVTQPSISQIHIKISWFPKDSTEGYVSLTLDLKTCTDCLYSLPPILHFELHYNIFPASTPSHSTCSGKPNESNQRLMRLTCSINSTHHLMYPTHIHPIPPPNSHKKGRISLH
jgi:hypothetical protein